MATLIHAITILGILGVCAGLKVGPVRLVNNGTHISYRLGPSKNNSLLECPVVLDEANNELLQYISWNMLGKNGSEVVGTYVWTPPHHGIATGMLDGVVNLNRTDGSLELTELRYDLGGYYECSATLTTGMTQKAEKWEALVVDVTSSKLSSDTKVGACVITMSEHINTIYPEPTVDSGLFSPSHQDYIEEVTVGDWVKVIYPNKSVGYSYNDKEFKIDENTTADAYFLLTVGVTKSDGHYISFYTIETTSILIEEKGCPALTHKEHQVETYYNYKKTCRNEYTDLFSAPKVTVQCQEGYLPEGNVSSLELTCDLDTFQWRNEEEDSSYDLHCVLAGSHPEGAAVLVVAATFLLRLV